MFEEDKDAGEWNAPNDKTKVIESHLKEMKKKKEETGMRPGDKVHKGIFGRPKTYNYYGKTD